MKRSSALSVLPVAALALAVSAIGCTVESTENNTIVPTAGKAGAAGTAGKAGTAGTAGGGAGGAAAGSAGTAGAAAGAAGAAAGSAGSAGAAAGSAGSAGAAAGSAGSAGAAAGSGGAAGAAAGSGGAAAGAGGAAAGAGGAAAGAGGAAAGAGGAAAGAGGTAGAGGAAASDSAYIRFAHLLSTGPAIDICIRPSAAASWAGVTPFFVANGSAGKFAFPRVSVLAKIPAGQEQLIRVVSSTATDCNTALAPNIPDIPRTFTKETIGTFAIGGTLLAPKADFQPDDRSGIDAGDFSLTGVHAHATHPGKVDFGVAEQSAETPNNYFVLSVEQYKSNYGKDAIPVGKPRFLVSTEGPDQDTEGTIIVTFPNVPGYAEDNILSGERYNLFYTSPSNGKTQDTLIVCAAFDFAAEQAFQNDATTVLPNGKGITALCATNND